MPATARAWRWRGWLLAVLIGLLSLAQPAQALTRLSVSSWAPPGHLIREGLVAWCDELAVRSRGDLQCDLLDQPVAPVDQSLDTVGRAAVDMAVVIHSLSPEQFVLARLAELPLLASSAESASAAYWQIWHQFLRKHDEYRGLRVLTVFTQSAGQLCTIGEPVAGLGDLAGLRLRAGGGVAAQVLDEMSSLGVRQSQVPLAASVHAIADHALDGLLITTDNIVRYDLQDTLQQCLSLPGGLFRHGFALVLNPQIWARLSKREQRLLREVSDEVAARIFGRAADRFEASLRQQLLSHGLVFKPASADQIKAWRQLTAPIAQAWMTAARNRGLANAAEVYERYQQAVTQALSATPAPPPR